MLNVETGILASAVMLGLGSGIAPGPLSALVVTTTLREGAREGAKASVAPAIADLPAIGAALFTARWLPMMPMLTKGLATGGAAFLLHLGYSNLRHRPESAATESSATSLDVADVAESVTKARRSAFQQALLLSLLGPYAILFWTGVGAPYLLRAQSGGLPLIACFIACYYAAVAACKLAVVAAAAGARDHLLTGGAYVRVVQVSGALIAGFGCLLLKQTWWH